MKNKCTSEQHGQIDVSDFHLLRSRGFAIHISGGGLHEQRTIGTLAFRTGLTAIFLYAAEKVRA